MIVHEPTGTLVFEAGDEVIATLEDHARRRGIQGAAFTAIGAFSRATLAFFNLTTNEYDEIPVEEQVEVAALIGNIGVHGGEPRVHAHCVLGRPDGSTLAGHLLSGTVRPTLELFLTVFGAPLERVKDGATGLPLIAAVRPSAGDGPPAHD